MATLMGMAAAFLMATLAAAAAGMQDCPALSDLALDGAKVTLVKAIPAGS